VAKSTERDVKKAVDGIQQLLTEYAENLNYADFSPEVIHAAKLRIIDTLGVLIGGFFGETARIARSLAAQRPNANGATILGTRMKTTTDLAAFVNATTACDVEMTDTYHWPGSFHGHPSDIITPILATAEHAQSSGREFITAVVLGYEVYQRFSDIFHNKGFDHTNFCCVSSAIAAGKLLKLSPDQIGHCISMAVVPNNILSQRGIASMFKALAPGHAGRAGVFAAILAREGMEGPHLPFEGKAGWCEHIARERLAITALGGHGVPFKILDTRFKTRPSPGMAISSVLAAEKIAPMRNSDVKQVIVEVYRRAKELMGTNENHWRPDSREAAGHSLPYNIAVTLIDGTIKLSSFSEAHIASPDIRALVQKVQIVENPAFTEAFERVPVEHRTRITVITNKGERLVGESGGDAEDMAEQIGDEQILEKFRDLTEDYLGTNRVKSNLDRLLRLEDLKSVVAIPPEFVLA